MELIDKAAVLAELNRLIAELVEEGESTLFEQGRISAFEDAKLFLDTLEVKEVKEEPVSEDLEEACEQLSEDARKHKAETSSPFFSQTDYKQGVMDGAKWQKEHLIGKMEQFLYEELSNGDIECRDMKSLIEYFKSYMKEN